MAKFYIFGNTLDPRMSTRRKPPVVAIKGNVSRDVVTQADLMELASLQEAEWLSSRAVQKAALELEIRISHGARVETGPLTFDVKLKMARTRKEGTG